MRGHLTYEDRCHIHAYIKSGKSHREMARLMGCSHTTINKEVKRNSGLRGYREKQAQRLCVERRLKARQISKKLSPDIVDQIERSLKEHQWSPVQISGRFKKDGVIHISHESIYRHIWADKQRGGDLYLNLRHKAKKYNKRGALKSGRGMIPNRVDIKERPCIVDAKMRVGDIELDTIVGGDRKSALVSMVDRASKYTCLRFVPSATAKNVTKVICQALTASFKAKHIQIHTLTSDNGKEFSHHAKITDQIGGDFFFATPYHSWERGLNEHTNGLVRQYFPKGTDFNTITQENVAEVELKLNNRPRKILDFETPFEALNRLTNPHSSSGNFTT